MRESNLPPGVTGAEPQMPELPELPELPPRPQAPTVAPPQLPPIAVKAAAPAAAAAPTAAAPAPPAPQQQRAASPTSDAAALVRRRAAHGAYTQIITVVSRGPATGTPKGYEGWVVCARCVIGDSPAPPPGATCMSPHAPDATATIWGRVRCAGASSELGAVVSCAPDP